MNFSTKSEFKALDQNGYLILPGLLTESVISGLIYALSILKFSKAVSRRGKSIYGVRNLLNLSPAVRDFSTSNTVRQVVETFLGNDVRLVRAIYFNKTENANWKVPWHQDLTIAVRE